MVKFESSNLNLPHTNRQWAEDMMNNPEGYAGETSETIARAQVSATLAVADAIERVADVLAVNL